MSGADQIRPAALIEICSGDYSATVAPQIGGSLASFRYKGSHLLRPLPDGASDAEAAAMFPMVPFVNRIHGNRLDWRGKSHRIAPNIVGEPYALHGAGWQSAWEVVQQSTDSVSIEANASIGPYQFQAGQTFRIDASGLSASLTVTNRAPLALPYGLGFHPWFRRTAGTQVKFDAAVVWDEAELGLAGSPAKVFGPFDCSSWSALPATMRNHCYEGWARRFAVSIPEIDGILHARVEGPADYLMLYADPSLDSFCLEPQTHLSGAFGIMSQIALHGLIELTPGECLAIGLHLSCETLSGRDSEPR
jgi:aldose 1-epimerase